MNADSNHQRGLEGGNAAASRSRFCDAIPRPQPGANAVLVARELKAAKARGSRDEREPPRGSWKRLKLALTIGQFGLR